MMRQSPESAQGTGLVIFFPLAIISNALVPTQHMPLVLRTIANWNPVRARCRRGGGYAIQGGVPRGVSSSGTRTIALPWPQTSASTSVVAVSWR
jgi:hypothetical protein